MDRGFWVTWYDLPQSVHDEYFAWMHERYIPAMKARTGALWAAHYGSVPKGSVRFRSSGHRPETRRSCGASGRPIHPDSRRLRRTCLRKSDAERSTRGIARE